MSYADAASEDAWDHTIKAGRPHETMYEEWTADYYAHFGATDRIALKDLMTELRANNETVAAYRVTWDAKLLKRADIVEVLTRALEELKTKVTVFAMASNATKAFYCKGTLWRGPEVDSGGGCGLLTDACWTGVTRVYTVVKINGRGHRRADLF